MFSFLFIQKKTVSVLKIVFDSIQQYWLAKKEEKKKLNSWRIKYGSTVTHTFAI